jgi:hypothetical protein
MLSDETSNMDVKAKDEGKVNLALNALLAILVVLVIVMAVNKLRAWQGREKIATTEELVLAESQSSCVKDVLNSALKDSGIPLTRGEIEEFIFQCAKQAERAAIRAAAGEQKRAFEDAKQKAQKSVETSSLNN